MVDKKLLLSKLVAAGETQATISEKLGVNRSTFNRCVNGKGSFDVEQAKRLCALLGITDAAEKVKIFLPDSS